VNERAWRELENAMALMTSLKKGTCTRSKGSVKATDPEMFLRCGDGGITAAQRETCSASAAARGVRYDVAFTRRGTPIPPRENYTAKSIQ